MGDVANGTIQLDKLRDHDLLVRIAAKLEDLPCEKYQEDLERLEGRTTALESAMAALRVQGGVVAAVATAVSTIIGVFVKP